MKFAIRYYSKTGNTERLAKSISEVLNIEAFDLTVKLNEDVDMLFLGASTYGSSIDPAIIKFFDNIDVNVGKIVLFATSGTMNSPYNHIDNLCHVHEIKLYEKHFHCPGSFVGMNNNRPNKQDAEDAKEFVKNIINHHD